MNALRFLEKGAIENLRIVRAPIPDLSPGEVLVRVKAAGINGSDAAGVQGWIGSTTVPRIPGRDFAGEVVKVHESDDTARDWVGQHVWGTGGDRGFSIDGTFAEYIKVPVDSLSRKPTTLSFAQAASVGLSWVCSWLAVVNLSEVKRGDNVLIIGARGAIGSGAAQLCRSRGANVFGTYRSLANVRVPSYINPIVLNSGSIRDAVTEKGMAGKVDVLLDCAGYEEAFNDALGTMRSDGSGRIVVMAVHRKDGLFSVDLRTLYFKALTLKGLKSSMLPMRGVKEALDQIAEHYDNGSFDQPLEPKEVPLVDETAVHAAMHEALTRSSERRAVIIPS